MLMKNLRASALKTFPFLEIKSRNDEYELVDRYVCPAETDDDVTNMEEASMSNYRLKYCLFEKKFQKDEDRICKQEVKPVFHARADKKFKKIACGFGKRQFVYSLSFLVRIFHHLYIDRFYNNNFMIRYKILQNCGSLEVLEKFHEEGVRKVGNVHRNM